VLADDQLSGFFSGTRAAQGGGEELAAAGVVLSAIAPLAPEIASGETAKL